jgi:hypothetical protein
LLHYRTGINDARTFSSFVECCALLRSDLVDLYRRWTPSRGIIQMNGQNLSLPIERSEHFIAISIPDPGAGTLLKLE